MASSAFLAALKKTRQSKQLDKLMAGNNTNWLREGTHDVTIKAIDSSKMDDNQLEVIYVNEEGKEYKDRAFLMDYNGEEFSLQFRRLLTGTLADTEAFDLLLGAMEKQPKVIEVLTGMSLRITLALGKGFVTNVTGNGKYIAFDRESNEALTEEFDTAKEAKTEAEGKGHKAAYLRIAGVEATNKEQNIAALKVAISALPAAASVPGPGTVI